MRRTTPLRNEELSGQLSFVTEPEQRGCGCRCSAADSPQ